MSSHTLISNALLRLLCFLLFLFFPFLFLFPPCSSSSCFYFTTNLPCSSPYLPRASSMLRTRPCKVNAPAATPQQRGRGAFPGQMRWAATVGNRGNLDQDRRATFTAEVEDACGNKLTQRAVEFPRHPSLEHCCAGRSGTNGTWTAC